MICGDTPTHGHFGLFLDILLKPPQPFIGLFFSIFRTEVDNDNGREGGGVAEDEDRREVEW